MDPEDAFPGDSEAPPDLDRWLARNRFRTPPPEWRAEILARARSGPGLEAKAATRALEDSTGLQALLGRLGERLASAWTVVAAAWLIVLALNLYASPRPSSDAVRWPPLSEAALADLRALRAQQPLADPFSS